MTNAIRPYAWGSRTAIATLQGRPVPSAGPEAELWLGAHPSAPSAVSEEDRPVPLTQIIARDPVGELGSSVADRFGPRLPYLLKVLAAAQPLSLQAHPDAEQARAGYAGQARAGYAEQGGSEGPYVDAFHKPELLVAIDDFEALCGFRDPDRTAELLRSFGVAGLTPVVDALSTGSTSARLRRAMDLLLAWPGACDALVSAVAAAADSGRPPSDPEAVRAHALAAELGRLYPGDIGVVTALLLNHVRLRRDDAVFMPAGNLHAYLGGVGIEVMAASDNVLRGGLTSKQVDQIELGRVLRYDVLHDPIMRPEPVSAGVITWPAPVAEFALVKAVAQARPVILPGAGPRIVICVGGVARLKAGGDVCQVRSGSSVFVAAAEPEVQLTGTGTVVFQASLPVHPCHPMAPPPPS